MENSVEAAFLEKHALEWEERSKGRKIKGRMKKKKNKRHPGIDLPVLISHTQAVTPPQHMKNSQA